jgi:hypothetical protein
MAHAGMPAAVVYAHKTPAPLRDVLSLSHTHAKTT